MNSSQEVGTSATKRKIQDDRGNKARIPRRDWPSPKRKYAQGPHVGKDDLGPQLHARCEIDLQSKGEVRHTNANPINCADALRTASKAC